MGAPRTGPPNVTCEIRDIVIAESAIKLGVMLVSDDARLRQVVVEFGGAAVPSAHLA